MRQALATRPRGQSRDRSRHEQKGRHTVQSPRTASPAPRSTRGPSSHKTRRDPTGRSTPPSRHSRSPVQRRRWLQDDNAAVHHATRGPQQGNSEGRARLTPRPRPVGAPPSTSTKHATKTAAPAAKSRPTPPARATDHEHTPPGAWLDTWTLEDFAEVDHRRRLITKTYPTGRIEDREEGVRRMKQAGRDKKALRRLANTLAREETILSERVAILRATPPGRRRDEALATVTQYLENKRKTISQTHRQQIHLRTRARATQRHTKWKKEDEDPQDQRTSSASSSDNEGSLHSSTPEPDTVPATDLDAAEPSTGDQAAPTEVATSPTEDPELTCPPAAAASSSAAPPAHSPNRIRPSVSPSS